MIVDCDVLIIGGGLAGATLALQLKAQSPDASIFLLERRAPPFPAAAHKVGESTVEIGAHYLHQILGLGEILEREHLQKFGFRFFHLEGREDIEQVQEIGVSRPLDVPSFQIDRGLFENRLLEEVERRGINLQCGASVLSVHLADSRSTAPHAVRVHYASGPREYLARWVIDASGRSAVLRRQFDLGRPNGHEINAVWFRLPARIDIEDWSSDQPWLNRCGPGRRWRSTNHLVGRGYWVWMIPLASGQHSIGIVADEQYHPFQGMSTFDQAIAWLEVHQPRLARAVRDAGVAPSDFKRLRGLSHDCAKVFSSDRWAITGEAGMFLDPFYSPGSDFIAIANTYISDLVARDLRREPWKPFADFYGQTFRTFYESTLALYRGQYGIFGDPEVLAIKVIWDYTYYWGVLCQIFFQNRLTNIASLARLREHLYSARELNTAMQAFLNRWAEVNPHSNRALLFDQAELPWFVELNRSLTAGELDDIAFRKRILDSVELMQRLAAEILARALVGGQFIEADPVAADLVRLLPNRLREELPTLGDATFGLLHYPSVAAFQPRAVLVPTRPVSA
jgi:flavin-dependent dehydrogenase